MVLLLDADCSGWAGASTYAAVRACEAGALHSILGLLGYETGQGTVKTLPPPRPQALCTRNL